MSFRFAVLIALAVRSATTLAQSNAPELVTIRTPGAILQAHLWRPPGRGPFPAVLVNHGSGRTREELTKLGPYELQSDTLGPVFARHGYMCFFLFRRGVGPSADQGENAIDAMNRELAAHGQAARNAIQLQLLDHRELDDATAALAVLRKLPDVDSSRVALVGHSFGGSLTILLAEREPGLRALVLFSAAGNSWDRSADLRTRLYTALSHVQAHAFFIHAANDYSLNPGRDMDSRLAQLEKPHRLVIYPPIGSTPEDGHSFLLTGVKIWEDDVFAFLNEYMRK